MCKRLCVEQPLTQRDRESLEPGIMCLVHRVEGADGEDNGDYRPDQDQEAGLGRRAIHAQP
eukprot:1192345-Prymnesium_polylepis.1